MQHPGLYVFMDKKTGRILGQFYEDGEPLNIEGFSLFDLPEEQTDDMRIVCFTTINQAKDWLAEFLENPSSMHFALADELDDGTAKLDIVAYEYKKVIE